MRLALPLAAVVFVAQAAQAQNTATLTLDEAVQLARRNNPAFLQTVNARRSADAQVRTAYASLLPSVSANWAGRYQKAGQQFFNGIPLESPSDIMQSSYSLSANYNISSDVLYGPRVVSANRAASEADVAGGAEFLRAGVTQQYLAVLQAQARADLQDTLVVTSRGLLALAEARQAVGAATILDVRRAEVTLGQSEVAALQQQNLARVQMLRLFQMLGVPRPDSVQLTTKFTITPITFNLDSLKQLAQAKNPGLEALRSRERASNMSVRAAQGRYLPTFNLSTGIGGQSTQFTDANSLVQREAASRTAGFASCSTTDSIRQGAGLSGINCASRFPPLTSADEAAIRSANDGALWKYTTAPKSFSLFVSLPIFDNLNREQRLQNAMYDRENARFNVRARELQTEADVTEAYLNLRTASRTIELQEVNAQRAREELSFAEERYRVGAATFLDVTTSRGNFEQAQIDRLNAIYDYHRAFAALENAVGRPLR